MYIEFLTANGAMVREISIGALKDNLELWCEKHNQRVVKKGYVSVNKYKVWLDTNWDPMAYTIFGITWNPNNNFFRNFIIRNDDGNEETPVKDI